MRKPGRAWRFRWAAILAAAAAVISPTLVAVVSQPAASQSALVWEPKLPASNPGPLAQHDMAFDNERNEVVLLTPGGLTWVWDGTNWAEVSPEKPNSRCMTQVANQAQCISPPSMGWRAMAYDEARKEAVLFGRRWPDFRETWTWNGIYWQQKNSPNFPFEGRFWEMTYDGARREVVLLEGWDCFNCNGNPSGSPYSNTWVWNGSDWADVTPNGPGSRCNGQPVCKSPDPARIDSAMAYDALGCNVVLFGGSETNVSDVPFHHTIGRVRRSISDTWVWDGVTWQKAALPLGQEPGARSHATLTYSEAAGVAVLFGGADLGGVPAGNGAVAGGYRGLNDTWIWGGGTWLPGPSTGPYPRYRHASAPHGPTGEVVLYGGIRRINNATPSPGDSDETWGMKALLPRQRSAAEFSSGGIEATEGDGAPIEVGVEVNLSAAQCVEVTVDFITRDGTAAAGSDYTPASGKLTFRPGQTTQRIPLQIAADDVTEDVESFFVEFSSPNGAALPSAPATVTINDDDVIVAQTPSPPPNSDVDPPVEQASPPVNQPGPPGSVVTGVNTAGQTPAGSAGGGSSPVPPAGPGGGAPAMTQAPQAASGQTSQAVPMQAPGLGSAGALTAPTISEGRPRAQTAYEMTALRSVSLGPGLWALGIAAAGAGLLAPARFQKRRNGEEAEPCPGWALR